jgi:hypothetical protein
MLPEPSPAEGESARTIRTERGLLVPFPARCAWTFLPLGGKPTVSTHVHAIARAAANVGDIDSVGIWKMRLMEVMWRGDAARLLI